VLNNLDVASRPRPSNRPCSPSTVYPVVWLRAREAALLCEAKGKRLWDAHD
jgi:hypothetical protein